MVSPGISRLLAARLPLERPWPSPILDYLWRVELFTLCVLGPVTLIGLVPLPGNPAGLILRVVVLGAMLVALIETVRYRIFKRWMAARLLRLRGIRRQWFNMLDDVGQLPADRQLAIRTMIRDALLSTEGMEEEFARGFRHSFVTGLEAAEVKLSEAATAVRSALSESSPPAR